MPRSCSYSGSLKTRAASSGRSSQTWRRSRPASSATMSASRGRRAARTSKPCSGRSKSFSDAVRSLKTAS
ncbi:hypothetical protein ACFPRL_32815 [Pseudoclavibacter helvolus]